MSRHPRTRGSALGAATALCLGLACGKSGEEQGAGGPLADYPAPSTVSEGEVIAEVGPVTFTTGEIEKRLRAQSPYVRAQLADPAQLEQWVENEVRLEALAQAAWEEGLHKEPEVIEKIRQLLIQTYTQRRMQKEVKEAEPNRAELIRAYEARSDEFNQPAKVRLSQIVRYVESPAERKKARELLEKVKADVIAGQKKNDHTRFAKAAREHSEDEASKLGAGDLQFLTREQLAERYGQDVADASFDEAKVGDLYVADAPNAVVLFKKTGRRRAIERSLEEVRAQLRNQLVQDKRRTSFSDWTKELLKRRGVSVDREALSEVKVPEREAPTPAARESSESSESGESGESSEP